MPTRKPTKKKTNEFRGHPYGISMNDASFMYYAYYYQIIYGPEMQEVGIYWELKGTGSYEYHGHPFMIRYNPELKRELLKENDKNQYMAIV